MAHMRVLGSLDLRPQDFAGHSFVFGELLPRANINLATHAKLTLDPSGKVLDSRHQEDLRWRLAESSLELVRRDGIITVSFNRVLPLEDCQVLVGTCLVAPKLYFLYPYRSIAESSPQMIYAIASHHRYTVAVDILLPQLARAGVAPASIWVVATGCPRSEVRTRGNVNFSDVTDNAYEYTPLLEVLRRNIPFDLVFLLHDTCHVGLDFRTRVESQSIAAPVDYMSVLSSGIYNMGLYRREFLLAIRPFLESLDGLSKQRAIDIERDRNGQGFKSKAPVTSNFLVGWGQQTGMHQPYSPDIVRNGLYLPGADIHKFYGMKTPPEKP